MTYRSNYSLPTDASNNETGSLQGINCISNYVTLPDGVGRMAAPGLTRTGNMATEELGLLMGVASLNPGGYIVYLL